MKTLFILGKSDVEMSFIIAALDITKQHYVKAQHSLGFQLKPGEVARTKAYWPLVEKLDVKQLVFIECLPDSDVPPAVNIQCRVVGHHHFYDPHYEAPASDYRKVSSLGRVLEILGDTIGETELNNLLGDGGYALDLVDLVSAYDHCREAAFQGDCPGITPAQMSVFCRLLSIHETAWMGIIKNEENRLRWLFKSCVKTIQLAGQSILDFRDYGQFNFFQMQNAQCEMCRPVIFNDDSDGVCLLGAKPWALTTFEVDFADENGLIDVNISSSERMAYARRSKQQRLIA